MNKPLLSILIPTVIGRGEQCKKLIDKVKDGESWNEVKVISDKYERHLGVRHDGLVSFEIYKDDKTITIGEKREDMYKDSIGLFSWAIDDDDDISDDAIMLILEVIEQQNPDCITFEEYINKDGIEYSSNHSLTYGGWQGDWDKVLPDGFNFWRTPFFKSVIKTEIAQSVPVPFKRFGEDHEWSIALLPNLKSEVHIPQQLYRYIHISSNPTERYGLDK